MSYRVLYRKYRPDDFDNLVGQNHVTNILKNSIKENKLAHAYLFSGPRGTGKTSTARILAKSVNCLDPIDGVACGKCQKCMSFAGNPDIIEIDAASNNGVDEIRELINNVKIMPTSLKYKVYIIDEVHMLSQSAFNALLLTLEEPPEHVIFILATTNLESVPITIVSRCQKFEFKRINDGEIVNRLQYICDEEKIKYDSDGLKEIAILSDGGMRDALSILDQLSKDNQKITSELVSKEVGSISKKSIESLIEAVGNNDYNFIEKAFDNFQQSNINYKILIKKLIYYLADLSVEIISGKKIINISFDTCKKLILELNDLINKININVDAYLLIKILLLGCIKTPVDNKITINNSDDNAEKTKKVIKIEEDVKDVNNNDLSNFIDIRINNCFVNASKKYLNDAKLIWDKFVNGIKQSSIKGLLTDTQVAAASDEYLIITSSIIHKDLEINEKIDKIEKLFNESGEKGYKIVSIDENRWEIEKTKYIENLKNKYKYEMMEEPVTKEESKSSSKVNDVANVFDINKIEII